MTHIPETGARKKTESIYGAGFRSVWHEDNPAKCNIPSEKQCLM